MPHHLYPWRDGQQPGRVLTEWTREGSNCFPMALLFGYIFNIGEKTRLFLDGATGNKLIIRGVHIPVCNTIHPIGLAIERRLRR